MIFRNLAGNVNQVSPPVWRRFVKTLFGTEAYLKIMKYYDCPCDDKNDPKCECFDVAEQFLTDYTWYCNQR